MNRRIIRVATLVALTLAGAPLLVSCGAEVLPVLLITNTWKEVGNEAHELGFEADQGIVEPADHGTFTGDEDLPGAGSFPIVGSWADGQITMTIQRTPHAVTFTGSFRNDPDTLLLSDGVHALLIFRERNP